MLYIGKLAKVQLVVRALNIDEYIRSCNDTLFNPESSAFIYLKCMHEVRRMVVTLPEIFTE